MPQFLLRLDPPRPTFPVDMSAEERQTMDVHADYWRARLRDGTCLVVGPVLDPGDPWGLAIVETPNEEEARALFAADPAVASGLMTVRVAPMRVMPAPTERSRG